MPDVVAEDGHTYNLSASANATEAPTSGITEQALLDRLQDKRLTSEQMEFVTLMSQFFAVQGRLMTVVEATDDYMFEHNEFVELIQDELVQAALQERGLVIRDEAYKHLKVVEISDLTPEPVDTDTTWKQRTLTPIQYIVANTMMDLIDTRSHKKKLQDLGVATSTYQMWLKDEVFNTYMRERAESMLGENHHEALLALMDKVRAGDTNAVKMYLEMTGRFVQQTSSSAGTTPVMDFKAMLVKLLEIINDEVHNPEEAFNIAERIKGLIGANVMATQLVQSVEATIEVPQTMPNRELTPRLQALMDKGAGTND